MPKRAPCSKVGRGLGAEVGQPVGAFVHVVPPVRTYVMEPHAYVSGSEHGELAHITCYEGFMFGRPPGPCGVGVGVVKVWEIKAKSLNQNALKRFAPTRWPNDFARSMAVPADTEEDFASLRESFSALRSIEVSSAFLR